MSQKKPKRGRPAANPPGCRVWAARVTDAERAALVKLLAKLRGKKSR